MPTSNWRPAPTDPQAVTLGSEFQFRDPLTPAEAVQLVQGQNLLRLEILMIIWRV